MTENDYEVSPSLKQPAEPGKMSKLAVVALILSCIFFLPIVPLVGAILGIVAVVRISPPTRGKGLAIAAIPVGFSMAFFIQGILAAAAIPAFINYMKRAKTSEARTSIAAIQNGALAYFEQQNPKRFPVASTGWTPATPCCSGSGDSVCRANPNDWNASPWTDLGFVPNQTHRFQWRYESDGQQMTVEARADLDCDNLYSSYLLSGRAVNGTAQFDDLRTSEELE
jgi:type II secretory pathway pseudopilin PulG